MPLSPDQAFPLMALTQDGTGIPHAEQARRLCAAGARWVQLRMKGADRAAWLAEASACAALCHAAGALLIVNDDVGIAADSGADGVHLGRLDRGWDEARRELGPGRLVGGTVNHRADAERAAASDLDYVGIGPFRFTATKQNLAPVLGLAGIAALLPFLNGLPAWAIGGIEAADLPGLRAAGLAGAAVSSALHRGGAYTANVRAFLAEWPAPVPSLPSP